MGKIDSISDYIRKCEDVIARNDIKAAEILQGEIVATYRSEIKDITHDLDNHSTAAFWDDYIVDYIGDMLKLKAILVNYRDNLEYESSKPKSTGGVHVTTNTTATATAWASISFEQTITTVMKLPDNILSADDKDILQGKLTSIECAKKDNDKGQLWDKTARTLKWIAEKGIEVGIAALPYIAKALENS